MAESYALQGKTVLITGAARGIGAAAARQVASLGARAVCVGLEPDELASVAESCGGGALWFEVDVTDLAALERVVAETVEQTGGIDVVVANAGIGSGGSMLRMPPEAFERVIQVNLLGAYKTMKACLPHVMDRRGYILAVASLAAITPSFPGFAPYAASKAGIEATALSLRAEVKHLGVDVGVAYFGWIDTDLVRGGDNEHPAFKYLRSQLKGPAAKTHPVSKAGEAIVRGIERRLETVVAPGWIRAIRYLRGFFGPLTERQVQAAAPETMSLFDAEYERLGDEMARPVGAGGQADARATDAAH
jgi:NAD(P)-dependent dehydrogenase (short-subunit alcohol dehydrogenase family)